MEDTPTPGHSPSPQNQEDDQPSSTPWGATALVLDSPRILGIEYHNTHTSRLVLNRGHDDDDETPSRMQILMLMESLIESEATHVVSRSGGRRSRGNKNLKHQFSAGRTLILTKRGLSPFGYLPNTRENTRVVFQSCIISNYTNGKVLVTFY